MEIKSITIGKQIWITSKLEVRPFRNHNYIAKIESDEDWVILSEDDILACCNLANGF